MTRLVHITTVPDSLLFLRGQATFMRERGFEITAITSPGPEVQEFGGAERVATRAVPMTRRITPLQDLASLVVLCRIFLELRPDIVHAHTPKGGLLGTLAAAITRVPIRIYHVRGLPLLTATGKKRAVLELTERLACSLATEVLCVSHSLRGVLIDRSLCPARKVRVLLGGSGNGVDSANRFDPSRYPGRRAELREQFGIPANATVFGFVGRLVRDKGVVELSRAWQTVKREVPDAHLLVIGKFEDEDPVPDDVKEALRSDERVHLAGFAADVAPLYTAMDVVVLPTYREGFPNVPLEAAAMGLPVVSTRVPGCVDAVVDGVTGTLVEARDADALAAAMTAYGLSSALRASHGRAGRERVTREFQRERLWQALYELYGRLLSEAGSLTSSPVPCDGTAQPWQRAVAEGSSPRSSAHST